jgi:hypothetical protein
VEKLQEALFKQRGVASDNAAFLFFSLLFLAFANTMPTVLTFPLEMSVFVKERRNAWYGSGSYYVAKLVADTPFQVVIPLVFCAIAWPSTGQVPDFWRFFFFCLVSVLVCSISQGVGILFGIIFLNNLSAAVFMAPLSLTPFFLLGGFFVTYSGVSTILKPITLLSYIRYAFESFLVIIYGFNRCEKSQAIDNYMGGGRQTQFLAKMACALSKSSDGNNSVEAGGESNVMAEMMSSFGITEIGSKDSEWLAPILDVNQTCLSSVLESVEYMMNTAKSIGSQDLEQATLGKSSGDLGADSEGTQFSPASASYMLSHWDLEEDVLWKNLSILFLIYFGLRVGAYILLIHKTNRKLKEY